MSCEILKLSYFKFLLRGGVGRTGHLISEMSIVTWRGQWPVHESIANEATHELGGYHDRSSWRTCFQDDSMVIKQCFWFSSWFSCSPSCRFWHHPFPWKLLSATKAVSCYLGLISCHLGCNMFCLIFEQVNFRSWYEIIPVTSITHQPQTHFSFSPNFVHRFRFIALIHLGSGTQMIMTSNI